MTFLRQWAVASELSGWRPTNGGLERGLRPFSDARTRSRVTVRRSRGILGTAGPYRISTTRKNRPASATTNSWFPLANACFRHQEAGRQLWHRRVEGQRIQRLRIRCHRPRPPDERRPRRGQCEAGGPPVDLRADESRRTGGFPSLAGKVGAPLPALREPGKNAARRAGR